MGSAVQLLGLQDPPRDPNQDTRKLRVRLNGKIRGFRAGTQFAGLCLKCLRLLPIAEDVRLDLFARPRVGAVSQAGGDAVHRRALPHGILVPPDCNFLEARAERRQRIVETACLRRAQAIPAIRALQRNGELARAFQQRPELALQIEVDVIRSQNRQPHGTVPVVWQGRDLVRELERSAVADNPVELPPLPSPVALGNILPDRRAQPGLGPAFLVAGQVEVHEDIALGQGKDGPGRYRPDQGEQRRDGGQQCQAAPQFEPPFRAVPARQVVPGRLRPVWRTVFSGHRRYS